MSETTNEPKSVEFKAEIKQLLNILIHSVYTSKDVFVRELISNAADALEKVRFRQAAGEELHSAGEKLEIRITTDKDGRLLTIADSGIGMTADEVEANIGTIAHSGATAFIEQLSKDSDEQKQADVNLIGQFGVGFYSVFMAADKVVLTSRTADTAGQAIVWTSDGSGSYTVQTLDEEIDRGTKIEIHLKEDDAQFADPDQLKSIIKTYSNFVPFPILVDDEQVNQTTALWREPPSQISDEQYDEFYKLVSHDFQNPLMRVHFSIDAPIQFSSLLFVPESNHEAIGFGEGDVNVQLYVQRVLIDGENKNCLPKYLRFVRGVVESEDLPLNVSRETLQQNRMIANIRDSLTRKLLDEFLKLAENDAEKYKKFWQTFSRILKEGYNDIAYREKLQELFRFHSSHFENDEDFTSLAEYVERMPESQSSVYYLSGPSREALDRDPRLELFRKHSIEVLYLYDMADEFVLGELSEYKEKKLVSADQVKPEDLGVASDDKDDADTDEKDDESTADIQWVIDRFKEILGDRVIDVRASERLVDSPACLVGEDGGMSGHMEKMLRMMNKSEDLPKRVLELNPKHALIESLSKMSGDDAKSPFVTTACEQLFEGCMLLDGYLNDPHALVERMNSVLSDAARVQSNE